MKIKTVRGYSLWWTLDDTTTQRLQDTIQQFSQKAGTLNFPPHITLLGQIEREPELLSSQFDTFCMDLKAIPVDLNKSGMDQQYFRSLYFRVQPHELLQDLHLRAQNHFQIRTNAVYLPHLSLLYSDLERNVKKRLLKTVSRPIFSNPTIVGLCLMQTQGAPTEWRLIKQFTL